MIQVKRIAHARHMPETECRKTDSVAYGSADFWDFRAGTYQCA